MPARGKKGERFERRLAERRARTGPFCAFCGHPGAEVEWEGAGLVCRDLMACEGRALEQRSAMRMRTEAVSMAPANCPVCGSVGARALMLDHIESEHPGRLVQVEKVLREMTGDD